MRVPRRFMFSDGCLSCTLRREGDFCELPHPLLTELHGLGHLTLYPPDAVLMTEGQTPRGVYIVCSGRVKLSVEAKDGKTVILKVAGERQVLGLSAVVSAQPSPMSSTLPDLGPPNLWPLQGFRAFSLTTRIRLFSARRS